MIPEGPIYYDIRANVLDAFADGCRANLDPRYRVTLSEWFRGGSYNVESFNADEIVFSAAKADIASALLTDVELFLNHCLEQQQEIVCFHNDTRVRSDAWSVVTIYYFAFFAASVFLRLIGRPILFISKDQIKFIKAVAGIGSGGPGASTYGFEKLNDISATHTRFRIKQVGQKIHEATWKRTLNYLDTQLHNKAIATDAAEVIYYGAICTKVLFSKYQSYEWPSLVRTSANYKAGFAYQMVERSLICRARQAIDEWKALGEASMLDSLDSSVSLCKYTNSEYADSVKLLHSVAQALFLLCRKLYQELLVRKAIDKRWEEARVQFASRMAFSKNDFPLMRKAVAFG